MSYIENNLMKDEKVVYQAKLHWRIFLGPIIMGILTLIFLFANPNFMGFFLIITAIWAISALIQFKTSEFGITNKRVLIKTGFIKRTSLETLLTKIEGIMIDQSILGRILDYGTIIIKGTGGTGNPFKNIANPMEFRKKVQELIPDQK